MDNILKYKLGGLLYIPAFNGDAAEKIINCGNKYLTSVCLCLEDSISDSVVNEAENILCNTLKKISITKKTPMIFVRVRTPEHLLYVHNKLGENAKKIVGYVLPKFGENVCNEYMENMALLNNKSDKKYYACPIIEGEDTAKIDTRINSLMKIKNVLDKNNDIVLNVRVGGNDFCSLYGLRRNESQTIYDIGVIGNILYSIIGVFSADYVVSGPVWEYYENGNDDLWKKGLERELELDKINGFIGKTAVHPSQLESIYNSLKVSKEDYEDALKILEWNNDKLGVAASAFGSRMNEVKCHTKWAEKVKILGEIYGIKE